MPQGDVTLVGGGAPIQVAATASPGTTVYTAVSGTLLVDLVHLLISNIDAATTIDVTVEVAGTGSANQICMQLRAKSFMDVPIMRLNNGAVVKVFASTTNKINVYVDADRYTL